MNETALSSGTLVPGELTSVVHTHCTCVQAGMHVTLLSLHYSFLYVCLPHPGPPAVDRPPAHFVDRVICSHILDPQRSFPAACLHHGAPFSASRSVALVVFAPFPGCSCI
jgi:hypothetical protein